MLMRVILIFAIIFEVELSDNGEDFCLGHWLVRHLVDAHIGALVQHCSVDCVCSDRDDWARAFGFDPPDHALLLHGLGPAHFSCPHALGHSKAVHHRHLNVREHQVKFVCAARGLEFVLESAYRFRSLAAQERLDTHLFQNLVDAHQIIAVVVNNEHVLATNGFALVTEHLLCHRHVDRLRKFVQTLDVVGAGCRDWNRQKLIRPVLKIQILHDLHIVIFVLCERFVDLLL